MLGLLIGACIAILVFSRALYCLTECKDFIPTIHRESKYPYLKERYKGGICINYSQWLDLYWLEPNSWLLEGKGPCFIKQRGSTVQKIAFSTEVEYEQYYDFAVLRKAEIEKERAERESREKTEAFLKDMMALVEQKKQEADKEIEQAKQMIAETPIVKGQSAGRFFFSLRGHAEDEVTAEELIERGWKKIHYNANLYEYYQTRMNRFNTKWIYLENSNTSIYKLEDGTLWMRKHDGGWTP